MVNKHYGYEYEYRITLLYFSSSEKYKVGGFDQLHAIKSKTKLHPTRPPSYCSDEEKGSQLYKMNNKSVSFEEGGKM